jgi:signal transduction histidine kinase
MSGSLERDLIDSLPALVFAKDLDGVYVLLNRTAARTFGSHVGMVDADVFHADQVGVLRGQDEEVVRTGRALEFHHPLSFRGHSWDYLTIKFPLRSADGEVYGVGGFAADVTMLREAEGRAIEAWRAAERASESKSQLIAEVSHELRTPLQSILGYSQLLKSLANSSEEARMTESIASAGEHLLSLTDELLIAAGGEHVAPRFVTGPTNACLLVDDVIEMIRPLAARRDMTLGRDVHAGLGLYVNADRRRLKQVLINLVGNAVRYGSVPGEVRVDLQRAAPHRLRFSVLDSGSGVRAEHAERLFAPFDRLDRDDSSEGSGLGLALSRSFIEAMGGTIGLRDDDAGAGFYVELDIIDAPRGSDLLTPDRHVGLESRGDVRGRVLCIDDSPEYAEVLRDGLGRVLPSVEVVHAGTGKEGLARASAERIDLVLLDLHLPDLRGEDVLTRLAGRPVIVISGLATAESIQRLRTLGAIEYLTKPVDFARLGRVVAAALGATIER